MKKDEMKRVIREFIEQMDDEADIVRIYKMVEYIMIHKKK